MDASQTALEGLRIVVYGGLAMAAIRAWRRGRDIAGAWMAATFVVLGAVVVAGDRVPDHSDAVAVDWIRKLLVAGLLLFPYLLFRFAASFAERRVWLDRTAGVLTAAVVGVALVVARFPEDGEPEPAWLGAYVVAVAVQWTVLSGAAARGLWRAGHGQAAVARGRMRLMATGSLVLNAALVAVVAGSASSSDTQAGIGVASQVLGFLAAALFFVGFDPPGFVRLVLRRPDLIPLREAEAALMSAMTVQDVADVMLPYATRVLGAKGAVLAGRDGSVVASHNLAEDEAAAVARLVAEQKGVDAPDLLAMPLRRLWLAVRASRHTPFFGQEEVELLRGLGVLAGLALDRVHLFEQEQASRRRAEEANAELETFVYSVSHDLKSPLVSLVGFLGFLRSDLRDVDGDVAFYLSRMEAGVQYMDALIRDLLELSRIGRVEQDLSDVDLGQVVEEVVHELGVADVEVDGILPVLHMSSLHARQLLTNLVGNALVHAGRSDVQVRVSSRPLPDGGVRITVADDGKGIPVEHRERVFRVFERLERGADTSGTGVGLAVCRKVMEQAGGSIRVGDSAEGAVFELDFPEEVVRRPMERAG